jgi:hypothetical protein
VPFFLHNLTVPNAARFLQFISATHFCICAIFLHNLLHELLHEYLHNVLHDAEFDSPAVTLFPHYHKSIRELIFVLPLCICAEQQFPSLQGILSSS